MHALDQTASRIRSKCTLHNTQICLFSERCGFSGWWRTYPMMQERKKLSRKPMSHHPVNSYAWEEKQGTGGWSTDYGEVRRTQRDEMGETEWGRARPYTVHTLYVNICNLKSKRLPNLEKPKVIKNTMRILIGSVCAH